MASRKILVDFWRTIEVVNAHRRGAVSIIDITALCYISFYVSAFCHAAHLSVSNVRFYVSRLRFQRKRPSGGNYRRSRYSLVRGRYLQDVTKCSTQLSKRGKKKGESRESLKSSLSLSDEGNKCRANNKY